MVALLHPSSVLHASPVPRSPVPRSPVPRSPVPGGTALANPAPARTRKRGEGPARGKGHLILLDGGRAEPASRSHPSNAFGLPASLRLSSGLSFALGAVAAVLLLALIVLRTMQAVPSATVSLDAPEVSPATGAEVVHVVAEGDTLWAIAGALAPGADPRPIVDHLVERNGSSSLQVGQRLVIPADLLQ